MKLIPFSSKIQQYYFQTLTFGASKTARSIPEIVNIGVTPYGFEIL